MSEFIHQSISERIIRIIDSFGVAMYLVMGNEKACLIDTGCGFGDLLSYVRELTDKPIFVLLTHGHFDHACGASQFHEVYMNSNDIEIASLHTSRQFVTGLFEKFYQKSLPNTYQQPIVSSFYDLEDGQRFDCGGITIEAIQVKGHTQGMMMILVEEEKIIIYGDACGVSVLLCEDVSSSVKDYRESLFQLKENHKGRYNRVLRNHGTFESSLNLLDNVIDCCNDVLEEKDDHIPKDYLGKKGFYLAKCVNEKGDRIDGKEGNIIYNGEKKW